jgi:hypothetical protein
MWKILKSLPSQSFLKLNKFMFTGKTETGHKFKTAKVSLKGAIPVFPPPGWDLKIPENIDIKTFCEKVGGDMYEHSDKFEKLSDLFEMNSEKLKEKGLPVKQRKYLLRMVHMMRRGLITFDFLKARTNTKTIYKLTKPGGPKKEKVKKDK